MNIPRRILVATDFSETSGAALAYAVGLGKALGAEITVAHVYELPVYGFPDGVMVASVDVATRIMTSAQDTTRALCDRHRTSGVSLTPLVRQGICWEEIHSIADEVRADLIVIGTHGRTGLAHALLGSMAEKIIRTATRPVLTIHAPAKPAESAKARLEPRSNP
jgi:nucleotide-binding universal stress UspA family protein